jgi:hypothetical protein
MAVAAHSVPDLADHVQDRAPGQGVEEQFERLRGDVVADHRAHERRAAADQPRKAQPLPGGRHVAQRSDDAEALGGVVQSEADHQHRGQPDLARACGDADREALGQVVDADRGGDDQPGLERVRSRG